MDPTTRRSATTPHPSQSTNAAPNVGSAGLPVDDEVAAKHIISTKTHYEALFVSRSCTESEIKVSYRKLALRFHPDRCKATSAEEAFKTISAAYGTLMDAKLRQNYDVQLQYGRTPNPFASTTTAAPPRQQGGATMFRFQTGGNGEEMTAEDLFNMFFFNQAPRQQARQQHQQQQQQQQQRRRAAQGDGDDSGWQQFIHYVPLIVMLLFTLLSMMPSQDPPLYQTERQGRYTVPYNTIHIKVPFFVTGEVHNTILREAQLDPNRRKVDLQKIHREVEDEYVQGWQERCTIALARKQRNSSDVCTDWTKYSNDLKAKRSEEAAEPKKK